MAQRYLMPQSAPTIRLFGLQFANLTVEEILARCAGYIRQRTPRVILTPNVAMLMEWRKSTFLQSTYCQTDLLTIDGHALFYAGRMLGLKPRGVASGSDLFEALVDLANRDAYSAFLLGARQDVLDEAATTLRKLYPQLIIAGTHHGYFSDVESAHVAALIAAAQPDILLVGMSSPNKERFLMEHREAMGVPVALGVGGMFDIVAGRYRRAPKLVQILCMEWAWRLAQEPRRLWKRYLVSNCGFLVMFIGAFCRYWLAKLPGIRKLSPRTRIVGKR